MAVGQSKIEPQPPPVELVAVGRDPHGAVGGMSVVIGKGGQRVAGGRAEPLGVGARPRVVGPKIASGGSDTAQPLQPWYLLHSEEPVEHSIGQRAGRWVVPVGQEHDAAAVVRQQPKIAVVAAPAAAVIEAPDAAVTRYAKAKAVVRIAGLGEIGAADIDLGRGELGDRARREPQSARAFRRGEMETQVGRHLRDRGADAAGSVRVDGSHRNAPLHPIGEEVRRRVVRTLRDHLLQRSRGALHAQRPQDTVADEALPTFAGNTLEHHPRHEIH